MNQITPDMVLYAYSTGVFPMANNDEGGIIYWIEPEFRGIIPLDEFKVSKSLKQTIKSGKYYATINKDFEAVIRACGNRDETWISEEIISVYCELQKMGHGFSFEVWNTKHKLVGGLYGVAMGKAFFGESMFSTQTDASKVALYCLVEWMKENSFTLLDTQYISDHLRSLGGIEITREAYNKLLAEALA
ncbi:MAG: leucyl/phenylalanyl-tRNA--protein transferase [Bacteroidia bacterium]|nr:leucyl/phenylalanyl-tRNA--protein transferase [Bacteroidia bacterium]MBP9688381.1 leucyl/phenylalanyl-tRNA--protein transferase [Bacteroidia bacterium]